ncbi:hypothetical protein AB0883_16300, partial [Micromonospora sp. NPDC047812]|uniref:hypothetical protein n=1 Tax=Micromonospora sp. NPDC047812 TaxID=3155742 RepID=UPI003451802B
MRPLVVPGRERRSRGVLGALGRSPVLGAGFGAPRRVPVVAGPQGTGRRPGQAAVLRGVPPVRLGLPMGVRPGSPARTPLRVRLGTRRLVRPPALVRLLLPPLAVRRRLLPLAVRRRLLPLAVRRRLLPLAVRRRLLPLAVR